MKSNGPSTVNFSLCPTMQKADSSVSLWSLWSSLSWLSKKKKILQIWQSDLCYFTYSMTYFSRAGPPTSSFAVMHCYINDAKTKICVTQCWECLKKDSLTSDLSNICQEFPTNELVGVPPLSSPYHSPRGMVGRCPIFAYIFFLLQKRERFSTREMYE